MEMFFLSSIQAAVKNWRVFVLKAIVYTFLGLWIISIPQEDYPSLNIILSVVIFISGILEITASILNRKKANKWGWHFVGGIFHLFIGGLLLTVPNMTMGFLPYYVASWFLFRSIMSIGSFIQLISLGILNSNWILTSGIGTLIFSIAIFSIAIFSNPILKGFHEAYITGLAFIALGAFRLFMAFAFRKTHKIINSDQ